MIGKFLKYLKLISLKKLPFVGKYKRYFISLIDSYTPVKSTYSQHGEDKFLRSKLINYNLSDGIYVDIGSNHPTCISNTYLFYRMGLYGIAIESNFELTQLHQKCRTRDIVLNFGCGNKPSLGKFKLGKAPVLSYFDSSKKESESTRKKLGFEYWRTEYVPILPLDLILSKISYEWIFLLSIDVEGMDVEVLQGSIKTLSKVLFCCVEANSDSEAKTIDNLLKNNNFALISKMGCNIIYENQSSWFNQYCSNSI